MVFSVDRWSGTWSACTTNERQGWMGDAVSGLAGACDKTNIGNPIQQVSLLPFENLPLFHPFLNICQSLSLPVL